MSRSEYNMDHILLYKYHCISLAITGSSSAGPLAPTSHTGTAHYLSEVRITRLPSRFMLPVMAKFAPTLCCLQLGAPFPVHQNGVCKLPHLEFRLPAHRNHGNSIELFRPCPRPHMGLGPKPAAGSPRCCRAGTSPVVSALAGQAVLAEPLGLRHLVATLLIIPGVALTQLPPGRSPLFCRHRRAVASKRPTAAP